MEDWLKTALVNSAIIAFLWFALQQYTIAKIRNRLEPLTAEETLRRQNLLNSKLKAYQDACDIICRSLAAKAWKGENVPVNRIPAEHSPLESEINKSAATLALFTSDVRVRDAFLKCFQSCSPADLGTFVGLLREDLGYGQSYFVPDQYPYIFGSGKTK